MSGLQYAIILSYTTWNQHFAIQNLLV